MDINGRCAETVITMRAEVASDLEAGFALLRGELAQRKADIVRNNSELANVCERIAAVEGRGDQSRFEDRCER
jgi:hypothetical protein